MEQAALIGATGMWSCCKILQNPEQAMAVANNICRNGEMSIAKFDYGRDYDTMYFF